MTKSARKNKHALDEFNKSMSKFLNYVILVMKFLNSLFSLSGIASF